MYNAPYSSLYNPQASIDRINSQIAELEKMKSQIPQTPIQQPTNLTQNFQLAPNNNSVIRYATSIDEVQKDFVMGDTPFFSKDMSVLWIKNTKGEIKSYELNEIIQKDEKDLQIEFLQAQINEMKGRINHEPDANANESTTDTTKVKEPANVPTIPRTDKKQK